VFSSFSKTQRFKEREKSFQERKFSMIDTDVFKCKNPMPEFAKQAGRTNVFFTPEQMQIMKEMAEAYKAKMQKIQEFKEIIKDNEKKYAIGKSYSLRFQYDEHANVKKMKPFIKQMISLIKDHAEDTRL
jgi:DNA modification methylase